MTSQDLTAPGSAAPSEDAKPEEATEETKNAQEEKPDSDDDSDDGVLKPIAPPVGPLDPSKCTAVGSGVGGGAANSLASFVVQSNDANARKVRDGGATVTVLITPKSDGENIEGTVRDNGDGSYSCQYTVPNRGDYTVDVEMNGTAIQGSPFPVFFSAPTGPPPGQTPAELAKKALENIAKGGLAGLGSTAATQVPGSVGFGALAASTGPLAGLGALAGMPGFGGMAGLAGIPGLGMMPGMGMGMGLPGFASAPGMPGMSAGVGSGGAPNAAVLNPLLQAGLLGAGGGGLPGGLSALLSGDAGANPAVGLQMQQIQIMQQQQQLQMKQQLEARYAATAAANAAQAAADTAAKQSAKRLAELNARLGVHRRNVAAVPRHLAAVRHLREGSIHRLPDIRGHHILTEIMRHATEVAVAVTVTMAVTIHMTDAATVTVTTLANVAEIANLSGSGSENVIVRGNVRENATANVGTGTEAATGTMSGDDAAPFQEALQNAKNLTESPPRSPKRRRRRKNESGISAQPRAPFLPRGAPLPSVPREVRRPAVTTTTALPLPVAKTPAARSARLILRMILSGLQRMDLMNLKKRRQGEREGTTTTNKGMRTWRRRMYSRTQRRTKTMRTERTVGNNKGVSVAQMRGFQCNGDVSAPRPLDLFLQFMKVCLLFCLVHHIYIHFLLTAICLSKKLLQQ
ncbi:hypothetical protein CYMTET_6500 [Cymbomonas tetramitiformis]|uniref:Uncharacterized protein n=1 Tax=Cymbomonas tetramitiformis TaxID=36881 RepID=A0AAE0GXG9_9CHLO|nr:hypothetical protein CYMTET_6500 [Cymbomonas tetramitiformis]